MMVKTLVDVYEKKIPVVFIDADSLCPPLSVCEGYERSQTNMYRHSLSHSILCYYP